MPSCPIKGLPKIADVMQMKINFPCVKFLESHEAVNEAQRINLNYVEVHVIKHDKILIYKLLGRPPNEEEKIDLVEDVALEVDIFIF